MQREDIVIVGAGPSGVAASVQCKRLGIPPVLLDAKGLVGGLAENAFSIENYPAREPVDGPTFVVVLREYLERFGLAPEKAKVSHVEQAENGWRLETDEGSLLARAVILATGTEPIRLEVSGARDLEQKGLFYEVRDVLPHLGFMGRGSAERQKGEESRKRALDLPGECLIIGGGEASLDYALTLARRKIPTGIFVRRNRLKARGRLVDMVGRNASIRVVYCHDLQHITQTERGILAEFKTPRGPAVEVASAVLAAVGRRPGLDRLLKGLDVYPVRTVSTRFPGLFIAGDARSGSLGQIGMAVGDGLAASMAAHRWLEQA